MMSAFHPIATEQRTQLHVGSVPLATFIRTCCPPRTGRTLQHLKDLERPAAGLPGACGNRADAVHPAVFFRACLKVWRGAEIIGPRVDSTATIEAINDLLRAVAKGLPSHVDLLLVIRFEGDPRLDLQHVVAAH